MKNPRVARTRNGGTYTEAQFWSRITNALRKTFAAWVPARQALKAARREANRPDRPQLQYEYQCAHCHAWFPLREAGPKGKMLIAIDHKEPAGRMRSYEDLPGWIARLTDERPEAFQILCRACHSLKTQKDIENIKALSGQSKENNGK